MTYQRFEELPVWKQAGAPAAGGFQIWDLQSEIPRGVLRAPSAPGHPLRTQAEERGLI